MNLALLSTEHRSGSVTPLLSKRGVQFNRRTVGVSGKPAGVAGSGRGGTVLRFHRGVGVFTPGRRESTWKGMKV